jgi:hypothetical protein
MSKKTESPCLQPRINSIVTHVGRDGRRVGSISCQGNGIDVYPGDTRRVERSAVSRGRRGKQGIRLVEGGEWRLCLAKPVHSVPDEKRDTLALTMGQEDPENSESRCSSKRKSGKIGWCTAHRHKPSK